MTADIEQIKKKIIYRSNYRGTKEMDKLLGAFTRKYLNQLNGVELVLEKKYLNGIISFNIENFEDKDKFVKKLGEKKIWIRVLEDPKWFRACVHQMTTEAEIDLLSKEIKKIIN